MTCEHFITDELHFDARTNIKVIETLRQAYHSGERLRLFLGENATGKAWHEEHDVTGTVGRSTGPCKVPLLIAKKSSHGGGAILTQHVVAILSKRGWLYKHLSFSVGSYCLIQGNDHCTVTDSGETIARFNTRKSAQRWIDFMVGRRMKK
jgi:hypothetical protein